LIGLTVSKPLWRSGLSVHVIRLAAAPLQSLRWLLLPAIAAIDKKPYGERGPIFVRALIAPFAW
jgi:hypothetical protein